MELVSPEGLRQDGRRAGETRALRCRLGVLPAADGSAVFELGGTAALAAVYGPREAPTRSDAQHDRCVIQCELTQAAFAGGEKRRAPRRDRRAMEASRVLRQALEAVVLTELLPRSALSVSVSVLRDDGCSRAAALNAAVLALADAGVPMHDTVAAACAAQLDGTPCVDPTHAEEGKGATVTAALLPATGKLLLLQHEGARCPLDAFEALMALAQSGAADVAAFMREQLLARTRQLAASRAVESL